MIRTYGTITPRIHPTAFVDDSAQVIGDVEIGEECGIWMLVVVRGDVNWIRIGRRTNIQDGTIIHVMHDTHPTTIGESVTVGHGAIVHGCTIGNRCLIGMGAIILNGAKVGDDSIVAAGSLLPEGFEAPARSLIMGTPAKIRRELRADELATIVDYANRYVEYRKSYQP